MPSCRSVFPFHIRALPSLTAASQIINVQKRTPPVCSPDRLGIISNLKSEKTGWSQPTFHHRLDILFNLDWWAERPARSAETRLRYAPHGGLPAVFFPTAFPDRRPLPLRCCSLSRNYRRLPGPGCRRPGPSRSIPSRVMRLPWLCLK